MNTPTMKNVFQKNNWNQGTVELHTDPLPILLIRSMNDKKLDKYCVKFKLCRDP